MAELDVNNLLKALDNEDHVNLLNTNSSQLAKEKNDILQKLHLPREELKKIHKKLNQYRYVDELSDLKYGQYLRWINISNPEKLFLTTGGIFLDLKLLDTGTHIMCKNNMNRIFQIKMDECIVFQKMSNQELIILSALDYLNS